MNRTLIRFFYTWGLGLCAGFLSESVAQNASLENVADWRRPWVSAINPATIPGQPARISLGLKAFQMGFLPDESLGLNESRMNVSLPFLLPFELGLGCDLKYYRAGAYSELNGGLLLGRRVAGSLALGAKLGLVQIGFSRDNFNLVNPDDPLLRQALVKTSFDLGLGLHWKPGKFSLGAGLEHLNQPDIGIQHSVQLPLSVYGALGYQIGPVTPAFLFQHDGQISRVGMGLGFNHPRLGAVNLAYQTEMPFKIEVQFNLNPKHQLHYGVDLPAEEISAVSLGSHELIYTWVIGSGPEIGQPELIISANTLKIMDETIIRSLPADLSPADLARSDEVIPEFLQPESRLNNIVVINAGALSDSESIALRTERYVTLAKEIRDLVHQHPDLSVVIRANTHTLKDARTIRHFLETKKIVSTDRMKIAEFPESGAPDFAGFQAGKETVSQTQRRLSVENLVIRLEVPGKTRKLAHWTLSILNSKKQPVRLFTGKNRLPEELIWNWRNTSGELIDPGRYQCQLVLQSESGQNKRALSPVLQVTRRKRTATLKFSNPPRLLISTN